MMTPEERASTQGFVDLARDLLDRRLAAHEFEDRFFQRWGDDRTMRSPETFRVLERFFFVVEDYVDDATIRDPSDGDLDEEQLRAGAQRFVAEVSALAQS